MESVLCFSAPEKRSGWQNSLSSIGLYVFSAPSFDILLQPRELHDLVTNDQIDIILIDTSSFDNMNEQQRVPYIKAINTIAELQIDSKSVSKRLAIILPNNINADVAKMISKLFSYHVYDFFQAEHGILKIAKLDEQLHSTPNFKKGLPFYEKSQKVIDQDGASKKGQADEQTDDNIIASIIDNARKSATQHHDLPEPDKANDDLSQLLEDDEPLADEQSSNDNSDDIDDGIIDFGSEDNNTKVQQADHNEKKTTESRLSRKKLRQNDQASEKTKNKVKLQKIKTSQKDKRNKVTLIAVAGIITIGLLGAGFAVLHSDSHTDTNKVAASSQSQTPSLKKLLANKKFATATSYYPNKVDEIENYIINHGGENMAKYVNEVYNNATIPTPLLEFDNAYFKGKWEQVINDSKKISRLSIQRKVMLSLAYFKHGDPNNAWKYANEVKDAGVDSKSIDNLISNISAYKELQQQDSQIQDKLNQNNLSDSDKQQLQQQLNTNQQTLRQLTGN